MNKITADLEYLSGHLRYGHIELELNDKEFEEFKNSTKEKQKEWLEEEGELVIDDFRCDDRGDIIDINY